MRRILWRAAFGALVLAGLVVPGSSAAAVKVPVPTEYDPGTTVVEPVQASIRVESVPVGTGCAISTWFQVTDVADAAFFTVVWARADVPGREYELVFNRHERGNIDPPNHPDLAGVPAGSIAGLAVAGSIDGPGTPQDDCLNGVTDAQQRFSIVRATVSRFVPATPGPTQASYEAVGVPTGPAADGAQGLDGCLLHNFISVPDLPGALSYTVTYFTRTSGEDRPNATTLKPSQFEPATPAGSGVAPYQRAGRLGHFLHTVPFNSMGCTDAARQWLDSARVPSVTKVTWSVRFPSCFGRQPTILATGGRTKGTAGDDVILGSAGVDTIDGRGGNDRICGGGGKDALKGGAGDDLLDGGAGADSCDGGPGRLTRRACES